MELKLSKSMTCRLAAKGKWGEYAAAWMGLSFFLRMVYYFGFMNLKDVPGFEIVFSVVLPLLIGENVGMSAGWAVAILSVFSVLTMLPLCFNCRERNYKPDAQEERFSPRQMLRYLRSNKYLLIYYGGFCADSTSSRPCSGATSPTSSWAWSYTSQAMAAPPSSLP